MNKIIDKKSNVLRICAGNDFSILVQITEYNTETGAWVNYDLSAVSDVHMCLIADNGKRINLPVTVNSNGTASAPIQAAYLQKTTYGVELTWLNEKLNRRTYAPCLLQIVTSTAESTSNIAEYDSNDAYHFNIKMEADVAILSIGKISDEYITESELNTELENYVTNSSLENKLNDYTTNASLETTLANYTTNASLETTLNNYTTNASLESTLEAYATKQYVDNGLANIDLSEYYTKSEVENTLNSYATNASLNTKLEAYATKQYVDNGLANIDLSEYYTKSEVDNTLNSYAKLSSLDDYAKLSSLEDYVTNTSLNTTLQSYVTYSYLNTSLSPITSDITSLDDRVTTLESGGSGVSQEDWDNSNEAIAKEFVNNRLEHLSINDKFNDYYTKTAADSIYATQSALNANKIWSNNKFVSKTDDVNRQEAIAAAFAYLQTSIDNNSGSDIDLSSYVTIYEMNNYSEVVSTSLTEQKLDIVNIKTKFNDYYTKSQTDNRYVTSNYVAQKYVSNSSLENLSYVVSTSLNDLNDRIPSYMSELNNDSGFIASTSVTSIWKGTQAEYDAITYKDTNILYIIL